MPIFVPSSDECAGKYKEYEGTQACLGRAWLRRAPPPHQLQDRRAWLLLAVSDGDAAASESPTLCFGAEE